MDGFWWKVRYAHQQTRQRAEIAKDSHPKPTLSRGRGTARDFFRWIVFGHDSARGLHRASKNWRYEAPAERRYVRAHAFFPSFGRPPGLELATGNERGAFPTPRRDANDRRESPPRFPITASLRVLRRRSPRRRERRQNSFCAGSPKTSVYETRATWRFSQSVVPCSRCIERMPSSI